jgi:hypothetical protein
MAKPKNPKKTNGAAVSTTVSSAAAVAPAMEAVAAETTTRPNKSTKKPSLVRTDARPTLVPINVDEEIRALAYLMSERRGFEPGHETEDWLAAEHEVQQRYHQQSV